MRGVLHAIIGTLEITADELALWLSPFQNKGLMCAVYFWSDLERGKFHTTVSLLVDVMKNGRKASEHRWPACSPSRCSRFCIVAGPVPSLS